ncbi:MAG TPA: VOC family protein [Thermoanaerobaculia bacterium]|jgi:catechol 2,3-dioxygenase-like lactoylglutathione lyase family enzyme|nr:VOC family protein [Thermoanaerobaculia bacterium]
MDAKPFLGLRTVVYPVPDIQAARDWYARILDFPPYFDEPFYVGFNVGGYELGLDPDLSSSKPGSEGPHAYWGVEDAAGALKRLLELGAREHRPLQEVGEGIKVASVLDPFGNAFGIIENPHFRLP